MTAHPESLNAVNIQPRGWCRRRADALLDFLGHMRRRWYLYLPVFAIWGFAYVRLFIDPTPRLPLLVNWTPSLPYHVALMQYQHPAVQRGDLIVFAFAGEAQEHYPGLRGQPFFKQVRGVPGDIVTVSERTVFVNGEAVGLAKPRAFDGHPLAPIAPTVIPPGHFYVQGIGPHSFDSRYAESGLVRAEQVVGIVVPIF
ncbi:conjugative transfer signal peptidase TraF [Diaphorobacter aerolatus]|uniref:Conjugative transfer signal peptidase TraF n=1 Tax=Diaphorobacter aerolatus TaxID=1288495 RepID=A0A7H0GJY5_9BURK|nr:conjugative transfer signal peptidase TraF [Diaphorobacter aerolatus]QNP48601.1 conjugative transfer signal peptidase TraF [Diaphorobacter aerolatus]